MTTYRIMRYFFGGHTPAIVKVDLTLDEALEHCNDSETSSNTCTSAEGVALTVERGRWFDGYVEDVRKGEPEGDDAVTVDDLRRVAKRVRDDRRPAHPIKPYNRETCDNCGVEFVLALAASGRERAFNVHDSSVHVCLIGVPG